MSSIVSGISIYPVKSLDPVELNEVSISERSLLHDREFAIFDENGKYVNGKRTPEISKLRAAFDLDNYRIELKVEGDETINVFHLAGENLSLNNFLSDYFGYKVYLKQTADGSFLDIPVYSGLTILSTSSLDSLSEFFPEVPVELMRRRFRANIEISGVEALWEDKLFDKPGKAVEYQIGDVRLYGLTPRARCIVPTRDPVTGNTYPYFTKEFVRFRKNSLPENSLLPEYEHFYFLSVDTYIPDTENGKTIKTGDNIEIIGIRSLEEFHI
ncbi:MAG TPA: MOSC N-terminal beta barrel domain-containing protein [Ignavibacteria bacterium]|nr:MOSC N-terminal beta barrel domain-containing protein [Ignavibacteria bacterium]HMR39353.1 MOSC N-terminal beta barrel domain-containing protein [Ignavibacteria bacterium]